MLIFQQNKRHLSIFLAIFIALAAVVAIVLLSTGSRNHVDAGTMADSLVSQAAKNAGKDNYALAYNQLVKAQTLYEEEKDDGGQATVNTYMALLHYAIGQETEYRQFLNAVTPYISLLDARTKGMYYRLRAIGLTEHDKNYQAAIESINKAIAEDKKLSTDHILYQDLGNLAEIYLDAGQYKQCLHTLNKVTVDKNKSFYSQVLYCRMRMALGQKHNAMARIYADSLLYCSRKNHQLHLQVAALKALKELDKDEKNYEAYIPHNEQYIQLRDSLAGANTTYRISKMQEQYNMSLERMRTERRSQLTKIIWGFLLISLSAITAIFWLLLRRAHEKKRIAELEAKNLDIEVERGKLERELMQLKMDKNDRQLQQSRQDNLKMSLQLAALNKKEGEKGLRLFDGHFELADSEFRKTLERKFPTMTRTELRLLCFIKLGIDTPEILSILNISSAGLYKLRYRLRKRLGLKRNDDLERFIEQLEG